MWKATVWLLEDPNVPSLAALTLVEIQVPVVCGCIPTTRQHGSAYGGIITEKSCGIRPCRDVRQVMNSWARKTLAGQPTLEIKGGSILVANWVNLQNRESTEEVVEWWAKGLAQTDKTEDFAKHIFRKQNKTADTWANRATFGKKEGWYQKIEVEEHGNDLGVLGW